MATDWPAIGVLGAVTVLLVATVGLGLTGVFGTIGSGSSGAGTETASQQRSTELIDGPPFRLATREVTRCGRLCRNVTSTVTNEQPTAARDVRIRTRLYAGNDTDGEVRWRRVEDVGRLAPGETYRATRQVELSLDGALAVREADGWVSIRTTVESADQRVSATDRRQVT